VDIQSYELPDQTTDLAINATGTPDDLAAGPDLGRNISNVATTARPAAALNCFQNRPRLGTVLRDPAKRMTRLNADQETPNPFKFPVNKAEGLR
jgi:hypothetical protein